MSSPLHNLLPQMLEAAHGVLRDQWPEVQRYAESELRDIAEEIARIEGLLLRGDINEDQARILLNMKKNTTVTVLLSIEGLTLLAAEEAINAAMDVVKDTVNTALKFTLL